MNVLVDVNVFEDVFRQRSGWETSLTVIGHVVNKQLTGYVSALTPAILYFLRRRVRGEKAARQAVQGLLRGFVIIPLGGEAIEAGYRASLPDFEDVLQLEAAKTAKADAIVTRNKKHFRQPEVVVLDPEELLGQLATPQESQ